MIIYFRGENKTGGDSGMDEINQYYDLVSDIVVMSKLDSIPDAIKLSIKLEKNFFDDIKPYIKALDLKHLDNITKEDLYENIKYVVYNKETNERKCIITDIGKQSIQDKVTGEYFEINSFFGFDVESGNKINISELDILNQRNRFEENFPSLVNMLVEFGEHTNSQNKIEFLVKKLEEQHPEPTVIFNFPKTKCR